MAARHHAERQRETVAPDAIAVPADRAMQIAEPVSVAATAEQCAAVRQ